MSSDEIEDDCPVLIEVPDDGVEGADASRIPVTIITGFLGAGKTTFLNYGQFCSPRLAHTHLVRFYSLD